MTDESEPRQDRVSYVPSIEEAMRLGKILASEMGSSHVMVGGGQAIYERLLPVCDTMLITHVDAEIPGDRSFPHIDRRKYVGIEIGLVKRDARNQHSFRVIHYIRR